MKLSDVEQALKGIHRNNRVAALDFLAALGSYLAKERMSGTKAVEAITSTARSRDEKRLAGSFMIRYIARDGVVDPETIGGSQLSAFLDDLYADSLYGYLGLEPRDQSFQKISALRDLPERLAAELDSACQLLADLGTLRKAQERLLRDLNGPKSAALLHPIAERSFRKERIEVLFNGAADYVEETGPSRAARYQEASQLIDGYRTDLVRIDSPYAESLLWPIASRLQRALREDFRSGPYSSPARLQLEPVRKHYPLGQQDARFDLILMVANRGEGAAYSIRVDIPEDTGCVRILDRNRELSSLESGSSIELAVPCEVLEPEELLILTAHLSWSDYDGEEHVLQGDMEFEAQSLEIDWRALEKEEPYSLEPVSTAERLAGRSAILQHLVSRLTGESLGSFWVWGQRRVGKTSLVKTLGTILSNEGYETIRQIFVEAGDFVDPDPSKTIGNLGDVLCEAIREADARLDDVETPAFGDSLSPLNRFLQDVLRRAPDLCFIFVIDEFDRLPHELYARGAIGQSFFLALRSISGKPNYGFVLVGGENMDVILSRQGQELNKFVVEEVDYFDRSTQFSDFRDLVARPLEGVFTFDDSAIDRFHDWTAGNPYFTNLIAAELFGMLVDRRDSYVIARDVDEAAALTISRAGTNSFQHFWDDGITQEGAEAEAVSLQRRQVLVALGRSLRTQRSRTRASIVEEASRDGLSEARCVDTLNDFERRRVLLGEGDEYRPKVLLLEEWLVDRGTSQILTSYPELSRVQQREVEEAQLRVQPAEIVELSRSIGTYRGREVTADHLRAWLDQFGPPEEQRLMFKLLERLDHYPVDRIRSLLSEAHGIATRGTVRDLDSERLKREDFLLTFVDGVGKSGAKMAQLYADENRIYRRNVVTVDDLPRALDEATRPVQVVVIVDDFVGTGNSLSDYLRKANDQVTQIRRAGAKGYLIALTGFEEGLRAVEDTVEELALPLTVHACHQLGPSDRCFSEESRIFPDPRERELAERIALVRGMSLVRNNPLGYGNTQAAVVLAETVPNNSLPILWKSSANWIPLFARDR